MSEFLETGHLELLLDEVRGEFCFYDRLHEIKVRAGTYCALVEEVAFWRDRASSPTTEAAPGPSRPPKPALPAILNGNHPRIKAIEWYDPRPGSTGVGIKRVELYRADELVAIYGRARALEIMDMPLFGGS